MKVKVDFTRQRTSWTKYDIVQVMEVIESIQILEDFKSQKAILDEPILKSFLGLNSLNDPLPEYWIEIQNYPNEKKLFALLAVLFTHGGIIDEFASKYSKGEMKGIFVTEFGKKYTNIRSALIESGASKPIYRRTIEVPYDFSPIIQNHNVGKIFKKLLYERIYRLHPSHISDIEFYEICFSNNFHKAIGISKTEFRAWLEGIPEIEHRQMKSVSIKNFYAIEESILEFNESKEIYFLGENGDGKSLILMAIYLAFNGNIIIEKSDQEKTGKAVDIIRNNKSTLLTGFDDKDNEYSPIKNRAIENFFAYGTHRGRYSTDNPEEYGFMSLFDNDQTLLNPISWLKDLKLLELENEISSKNSKSIENKNTHQLSIELLENMFYNLLERNVEINIDGNDVSFKEKGMSLKFDQLSEGYKSIIIFISDLIYRLSKKSTNKTLPNELKGVVLVDEIDLHLHPKWQRVIVSRLRTFFPNIQFVFTTHSPTIIQGASEDAIIFRVYRNIENGKTRISDPYFRKNLDHLMINTLITSPLFGLEDSRMNKEDNQSDTSETYLLYRINRLLKNELEMQKKAGKNFISDNEIDDLIKNIIEEELK